MSDSSSSSFQFNWESGVALGLLALYPITVFIRYRHDPLSSTIGVNLVAKRRWALRTLEKESRAQPAVHTLRNTVIVASLLATTSISIGSLVLQASFDSESGSQERVVFLALGVILFSAFFSLLTAVRAINNAGYLTMISNEKLAPTVLIKETGQVKERHRSRSRSRSRAEVKGRDSEDCGAKLDLDEQKLYGLIFEGYHWDPEDQLKFHVRKINTLLKAIDISTIYMVISFRLLAYCIPVAFWLLNSTVFLAVSGLLVTFLLISNYVGSHGLED